MLAINKFETINFNAKLIRAHALKFSVQVFKQNFNDYVKFKRDI